MHIWRFKFICNLPAEIQVVTLSVAVPAIGWAQSKKKKSNCASLQDSTLGNNQLFCFAYFLFAYLFLLPPQLCSHFASACVSLLRLSWCPNSTWGAAVNDKTVDYQPEL